MRGGCLLAVGARRARGSNKFSSVSCTNTITCREVCEKVSSSPAPYRADEAHTGPTDGLADTCRGLPHRLSRPLLGLVHISIVHIKKYNAKRECRTAEPKMTRSRGTKFVLFRNFVTKEVLLRGPAFQVRCRMPRDLGRLNPSSTRPPLSRPLLLFRSGTESSRSRTTAGRLCPCLMASNESSSRSASRASGHGGLSPPAGDEPSRLHRLHPRHTRPGGRQTCRRSLAPQLRQRARLSPRRCQLGLPAPWPLPTPGRRPRCATWPRPCC